MSPEMKAKLYKILRTGKLAVKHMRQGAVRSKVGKTIRKHPEYAEIVAEWKADLDGWKNPYALWLEADEWEKSKKDEKPAVDSVNPFKADYVLFMGKEIIPAAEWSSAISVRLFGKPLVIYGDEDLYVEGEGRRNPFFKPDYSPETLMNTPYLGEFILVRRDVYDAVFRNIPEEDGIVKIDDFSEISESLQEFLLSDSTDFEEEKNPGFDISGLERHLYKNVLHVPCILSHRQAGDYPPELKEGFNACKQKAVSIEPGKHAVAENTYLDTDKKQPLVSIIIPSKDNPSVLDKCVKSIREKTVYKNIEIIVVDNGSEPAKKKEYELLSEKYSFKYIYEPLEFNFSHMNNTGLKAAEGELVLLLNDDTEVVEPDWLGYMVYYAMMPEVGAVGAKLLYALTDKIQHVGVTNMAIGPAHKLLTYSDKENYYFGRNRFDMNVIAVTGACLLVSREKLLDIGGLDEDLRVAYNDIDLCFKLIEAGYRNVQCNSAVLYHYESLSRGYDSDRADKWERLLDEKDKLYERHPWAKNFDPYYSPNLLDNSSDYAPGVKNCAQDTGRFARFYGTVNLPVDNRGTVMGKVDRVGTQLKTRDEQYDYIWLEGWSFVKGEDNRRFRKSIVLVGEENREYELFDTYRKDVADYYVLPEHLDLCGFFFRFPTESIKGEEWKVGILHTDLLNGRQFFLLTDTVIKI